jgi:hypothetical protein
LAEADKQAVPISIVGLPGSGKTTFLAALWELVQEVRVAKALRFHSVGDADHSYLRKIVKVWRSAKEQARTELTGLSSVRMNLQDHASRVVQIVIPDVPGEDFRSMWEDRELGNALGASLGKGNILLLLHGNKVKAPAWITERAALREAAKGEQGEQGAPDPKEWHPRFAPTQVQLVELLQQISHPPVGSTGRRVVVMISAWDKVEGEELSPESFLSAKLPMLFQYLAAGRDGWDYRVYGVSAQGGEYDENDQNKERPKKGKDADRLREVDVAAERIRLVFEQNESHDLTEPLQWLMN